MVVVSDTSPLINLAAIDHLWLIPKIYGQVIIPLTVFNEIVVEGIGEPGASEIQTADWVLIKTCSPSSLWDNLKSDLDPGEAEAIALAVEIGADRILMDERKGRQIAINLSLKPVGVLGILLRAKHEKFVPQVRELMDRLLEEADFYIHTALYDEILALAGE
jgi:predicted nucleic acid-binding protein